MSIVLRECLKEDAADVLKLIQQAFAEQQGVVDPPSSANRKTVQDIYKDLENGFAFVAEDFLSNEIVGCVFLTSKEQDLHIGKLSVLPNRRGESIAYQLMQRVQDFAKENNFESLSLYVRIVLKEQQDYYKRFGFEQVGLGTHDDYSQPTFLIMEKKL